MTKGPSTYPASEWESPKQSVVPSQNLMTTPPASPQSYGSGSLSINSKEVEEKEQG